MRSLCSLRICKGESVQVLRHRPTGWSWIIDMAERVELLTADGSFGVLPAPRRTRHCRNRPALFINKNLLYVMRIHVFSKRRDFPVRARYQKMV